MDDLQPVIEVVKHRLANGDSIESLKTELLSKGYSDEQIKTIYEHSIATARIPKSNTGSKKVWLWVTVSIIFLISSVVVIQDITTSSPEQALQYTIEESKEYYDENESFSGFCQEYAITVLRDNGYKVNCIEQESSVQMTLQLDSKEIVCRDTGFPGGSALSCIEMSNISRQINSVSTDNVNESAELSESAISTLQEDPPLCTTDFDYERRSDVNNYGVDSNTKLAEYISRRDSGEEGFEFAYAVDPGVYKFMSPTDNTVSISEQGQICRCGVSPSELNDEVTIPHHFDHGQFNDAGYIEWDLSHPMSYELMSSYSSSYREKFNVIYTITPGEYESRSFFTINIEDEMCRDYYYEKPLVSFSDMDVGSHADICACKGYGLAADGSHIHRSQGIKFIKETVITANIYDTRVVTVSVIFDDEDMLQLEFPLPSSVTTNRNGVSRLGEDAKVVRNRILQRILVELYKRGVYAEYSNRDLIKIQYISS